MWPTPFHNTWESGEDFMNGPIPADQFNTGTYWDDTWISPPDQWYSPGSELQAPIFGAEDDFGARRRRRRHRPYRVTRTRATGDDATPPIDDFGADWEDVADAFGGAHLPSEEERFELDEIELGRRGGRRRRRPKKVVLPGGKEDRMDVLKLNKRGKKKGTVKVAVKTGFPHQVERRAIKRMKRVLSAKGYKGAASTFTAWFPIITPVGPIPYNYKGYTPVQVHFTFTGKKSTQAPQPRRSAPERVAAPVDDFYEDEGMAPASDDWAQAQDPSDGTFDDYFGGDLLDGVNTGNEFLF